jgi:hypothetical protein
VGLNKLASPDQTGTEPEIGVSVWTGGNQLSTPFIAYKFNIVYRQGPLGPADPSFRALSGRLKFTVRRHKLDSLS